MIAALFALVFTLAGGVYFWNFGIDGTAGGLLRGALAGGLAGFVALFLAACIDKLSHRRR